MSDMEAKVVLTLQDKITAAARKIVKTFTGVKKAADALNKTGGRNGLAKQFSEAEKRAVALRNKITQLKTAMTNIKTHAGKVFGRAGIAGLIFGTMKVGALAAGTTALSTAADFEVLRSRLKTTFQGSQVEAEKAFTFIKKFAAKTPFQVSEITEAFIKLKEAGVDPTNGSLEMISDASAARGRDILQGTEALTDALLGENERLKEAFSITGRVKGNKVKYNFVDGAGKQKAVTADLTSKDDIAEKLLKTLSRYKGAAEEQSKGWKGLVSNLADVRDQFLDMTANSGPFQRMKDVLKGILDEIDNADKDGRLKRFSEAFAQNFNKTFDAALPLAQGMWNALKDMAGVIDKIATAAGGYKNLGYFAAALWVAVPALKLIGGMYSAAKVIGGITALVTGADIANLGAFAGVLLRVAGSLTVLAGAAWLVEKNQGKIRDFLDSVRPPEQRGSSFPKRSGMGPFNPDDPVFGAIQDGVNVGMEWLGFGEQPDTKTNIGKGSLPDGATLPAIRSGPPVPGIQRNGRIGPQGALESVGPQRVGAAEMKQTNNSTINITVGGVTINGETTAATAAKVAAMIGDGIAKRLRGGLHDGSVDGALA